MISTAGDSLATLADQATREHQRSLRDADHLPAYARRAVERRSLADAWRTVGCTQAEIDTMLAIRDAALEA